MDMYYTSIFYTSWKKYLTLSSPSLLQAQEFNPEPVSTKRPRNKTRSLAPTDHGKSWRFMGVSIGGSPKGMRLYRDPTKTDDLGVPLLVGGNWLP